MRATIIALLFFLAFFGTSEAAVNQGRIWSSGFELNSLAADMEIEAVGGTGTQTIVTSPVHAGTYALETARTGTTGLSWARYRFAEANSNGPFYFRFYLRIADYPDATQSIVTLDAVGGGDRAGIRMTPSGALQLADLDGIGSPIQIGSDSAALSLNTWYRVEMLYDASAGLSSVTLTARLDGSVFATSNTVTNTSSVGRVTFGGAATGLNYDYYWDDIAINTATWPGTGQIILLRPNAIGDNSGWAIGAGSGSNYQQVDEVTPDDITTYLSEATASGLVTDDYNIENASSVIASDSLIVLAQVGVRGGGTGTTARTYVLRIKSSGGGTVEESASVDWSLNSWRTNNEGPNAHNYDLTLYDLPGASVSDWTVSDLDSAQIGVRHDALNTNAVRLSAAWLLVEYNPAPPDTTAPAAVANLATSNPTVNSIDLSWTAPGDDNNTGTATNYDLRYSTSLITAGNFSGATQVVGEPAPQIAGTSQTMTVSGLSPSTAYYFALKTSDEVPNTSAISNVPTGTTASPPDTTAPAAVSDLAASNPTNNSVDLSWTAPGDDNNTGTATGYDLRYSTSLITSGNFGSATQATGEPAPQIAGTAQSMTVSGLSPSTTYYFSLKTSDEVPNTSAISNVPTGITTALPDTTAPAAVSDLALSSPTVNSITVSWTAPGDDENSGTATSYDLRYSTSLITAANFSGATAVAGEPVPSIAGSAESVVVSGLNAGATYYFALKTSDEVPNISVISNVPNLATAIPGDTTAPAAVSDLAASGPTTESVTLSWTAPGDDGNTGTAASYDLRYSISNITDLNFGLASQVPGEPLPLTAGTSQNKTVSGLSPDMTYYFALKTSDEANNVSGISNVAVTATLPGPSVPSAGSGGGPLSSPTQVSFSGRAYPGGKVKVYRRSIIEGVFRNIYLPDYDIVADKEGNFSKSFTALLQANYLFALEGIDKDGRSGGILAFNVNLLSTDNLSVKNIFFPPTVNFDSLSISKGRDLTVSGYAAPGNLVEMQTDGVLTDKTNADSFGHYQFKVNTQSLPAKTHFMAIRQSDSTGVKSDYGPVKSFLVSLLVYPKADLNGDVAVNITDWSIFLSRWRSVSADLRKSLDMNADGKVDIADFSIFLKAMKGL